MANKDIKTYAKDKNVKHWQIAQRLNINDGNFSRKLRVELSDNEKKAVMEIIDDLSECNESEEEEMANLIQCDLCKATQKEVAGMYYIHIKKRKALHDNMSEAKAVDNKLDICEKCYQKLFANVISD